MDIKYLEVLVDLQGNVLFEGKTIGVIGRLQPYLHEKPVVKKLSKDYYNLISEIVEDTIDTLEPEERAEIVDALDALDNLMAE